MDLGERLQRQKTAMFFIKQGNTYLVYYFAVI